MESQRDFEQKLAQGKRYTLRDIRKFTENPDALKALIFDELKSLLDSCNTIIEVTEGIRAGPYPCRKNIRSATPHVRDCAIAVREKVEDLLPVRSATADIDRSVRRLNAQVDFMRRNLHISDGA